MILRTTLQQHDSACNYLDLVLHLARDLIWHILGQIPNHIRLQAILEVHPVKTLLQLLYSLHLDILRLTSCNTKCTVPASVQSPHQ